MFSLSDDVVLYKLLQTFCSISSSQIKVQSLSAYPHADEELVKFGFPPNISDIKRPNTARLS